MTKAIVIYGSTTGNTETLSEGVAKGLKKGGVQVTIKNVIDADVNELADYDLIVLGCSTWYDGELQDDFLNFHEEMQNISLAGKRAAVFGPGDEEGYPDFFCAAVDILEERLKECGAELVAEGLKVDVPFESTSEDLEDAESWGLKVAESL